MDQLFNPNAPIGHAVASARPGCRLQRLEVFNWGTFDAKVWTFAVDGRNALLTGDIGSGKSTLVDAVTTLLMPSQRISYNKAAGANTRERDLRSYVLGHYKSERNETTGTSRAVGLRDARNYSVILAVFANADFGDTVTLAQAFRTRDQDSGQPDRFYVVADADLSIAKDFSEFGTDVAGLRRRLRDRGARLHDTFPEYGKDFRRRLGIESEQAMDLFHQTVSMKAVDNLNDFVRAHMLEPFDAAARIESLVEHFDDLTRAHDAVVRARAQLDLLEPLVADFDAHDGHTRAITELERQQRALPFFFADRSRALLEPEVTRRTRLIAELDAEIGGAHEATRHRREQDEQLALQIAQCGGNRLATIEQAVTQYEQDQPVRRERYTRFNRLLADAGLDQVSTTEQFAATSARVQARDLELADQETVLENNLTEQRHQKRSLDDDAQSVNDDLRSLSSRQSNLPRQSLELRDRMCADLAIDANELPFAGELIQVREDATEWEGAAERVLRSFALSLLVPTARYDRVASWINDHHLATRVVYFRVPERIAPTPALERRGAHPLLVDLLDIKPESDFGPWLDNELARRANHQCVRGIADLRTTDKAVTRQGQIKDRNRHEKDDRRRIDDRRAYVLGWTNAAKVDALIAYAQTLQGRQAELETSIAALTTQRRAVSDQRAKLTALGQHPSWEELDWQSLLIRIEALRAEAARIRASSDQLQALSAERERVRHELIDLEQQVATLGETRGAHRSELERAQRHLTAIDELLADEATLTIAREVFGAIATLASALDLTVTDLDTMHRVEREVAGAVAARRDDQLAKQHTLGQRIVRAMGRFRSAYPQETAELDDSLASATEYRELHQRVAHDDLPRFEADFKRSLNQETIREIAGLSAALHKQETIIRDRIKRINASLHDIDYNDGRYIRLVPDQTPNTEIRGFREELRACTDNVMGPAESDQYDEARFLQVKVVIDRFKGREGAVDQDRTWTRRVTDVRQWFVFSASERWRNDDAEHENYTDSAGKSGGQKEKLAYTILAASLAYQFKLDWQATRSRAFCFVVIDEAFGRGSDDSTRYALRIFTKLGLQLLIVTPLQKIHVIEPHVSSVGFVDNLNGNYSRLQCLTVEEHQRRRLAPRPAPDTAPQ